MPAPFKVIIVGGGPIGLILAHIFSAVGIDYIVLERHSTFETATGGTTIIWPHNIRVLDQLGIKDSVQSVHIPLEEKVNLCPDGSIISQSKLPEETERLHGHLAIALNRFSLVKSLYDTLPDKTKVLPNQEIEKIAIEDDGVTVYCKDGKTQHHGSLVVGADGVKSRVRSLMRDLARSQGQDLDQAPFLSTYRALFGYTKGPIPGSKPNMSYEIRGKDVHFQVVLTESQVNFGAFFTLPEPTTESPQFTIADQEEHASRVADRIINPDGYRFGDLWADRKWSYLTNLEEGLIHHWHWHRVVLIGDSVCKQAPQAAFGLNTGIQNAVAFTNSIMKVLKDNRQPNLATIEQTLASFQRDREASTRKILQATSLSTRKLSWHSLPLKFADLYIVPYLGGDTTLLRWGLSPQIQDGLVLDDVEEKNRKDGSLKWKRYPQIKTELVSTED